jgi:hypothetical protein
MPWAKGTSGNPRGRPLGTYQIGKLRAALAEHVPDIIEARVKSAKQGDAAAAKLVLERVVPPLRAEELPVSLEGFAGSRTALVAAVVEALANGQLDTARGGRLIALLTPSELDERVTRIEQWYEAKQSSPPNER